MKQLISSNSNRKDIGIFHKNNHWLSGKIKTMKNVPTFIHNTIYQTSKVI